MMDKLYQWSALKTISCPSCGDTLLMNADNIIISHNNDRTKGSFLTLTHKICAEIKPKPIHICVQCGARSSRSRSRLANRECTCPKEKDSLHSTPTPDTFSTAPYLTCVINVLSRESDRSLGIDAITRFVTTSHDVPYFQKDCLLEAMTKDVEEGYFTENAGQYLLNRKQSLTNADANGIFGVKFE